MWRRQCPIAGNRSDEHAELYVIVYIFSCSMTFVFLVACDVMNLMSADGVGDLKSDVHVSFAICGDVVFVKHAPVRRIISIICGVCMYWCEMAIWSVYWNW